MYCICERDLREACIKLKELISDYQEKKEKFENDKTFNNYFYLENAREDINHFGMRIKTESEDNIETDNEELRNLFNTLIATFYNINSSLDVIDFAKSNSEKAENENEKAWHEQMLSDNYKNVDGYIESITTLIDEILACKTITK